ncbi:MAG: nucleotidyltransferase family protein [Lentisphaerae bacterium]|nr:nucleotidyltransferase family protein [Lentisphaerota bacterium]
MKAVLLAAGVGARLQPLTDHIPKCLVPINGLPLLGHWFRLLARHGYTDLLVNTHHLGGQVRAFVEAWRAPGLRIALFHEPVLLGSAGTVAANRRFMAGAGDFLIVYADNLTDMDLSAFRRFHVGRRSPFTIGLFESPEPSQCGIAECNSEGRILSFEEKPAHPRGCLANAGIYLAGPSLFDLIPPKPYTDFGFDVLPRLVGRMFGYRISEYYRDLGTPERLAQAQRDWQS